MHGGCLQMGCRPSKAANTAAAMCMRSETESDYIAQAKRLTMEKMEKPDPTDRVFALYVILHSARNSPERRNFRSAGTDIR